MEKRWILCASIAAVAACLSACDDDTVTPQEVTPVPYCDTAQCPKGTTCNEERRMCVSDAPGVVETNPCDKCTEAQECVNKTCVDKEPEPPLTLCSETDAPTCNGNAVVTCVDGELVPTDCEDKVCKEGECVEAEIVDPNACDPAEFELYCEENSVVSCVDDMLHMEPCLDGQYCDAGACYDTDLCPDNPDKMVPGECGCALSDSDLDENGKADCLDVADLCPDDSDKTHPGQCGCGIPEGTCDDGDMCPDNPAKTVPGICGCEADDIDSDLDGIPDCIDKCPDNPYKYVDDGCACDRVQVSIDSVDYCAIPVVGAQGFVDVINGIADGTLEVTADSVYALVRNINLADVVGEETEWKPVTFSGKLTSGGNVTRTISYTDADGGRLSLRCAETDTMCGLFGTLSGARIHNINLNLNVGGKNGVGGLAGVANSNAKVTSIHASTDITGAGSNVGGLVGSGSQVSLSGIVHQGRVVNVGANVTGNLVSNTGGIAGRLDASTISDCINRGRVSSESENTDTAANYLGGIVGFTDGSTLSNLTNDSVVSSQTSNSVGGISGYTKVSVSGNTKLVNNGYVKGYNYTGGLFGQLANVSNAEGITHSINHGTVAGLWAYTGGIVGVTTTPLKYVVNHGTVSGSTDVGGISGQQQNNMDHVYNDGTVWSENAQQGCSTNLGGISGRIIGGFKHQYLTNHGNVVADWAPRMAVNNTTGVQSADDCPNQHYGGIAGFIYGGGTKMEYVYNSGQLSTSSTGLRSCGGIAGWAHSVELINAKNTGNIKGNSCVGGIFGRFGYRDTAAKKGINFLVKNVENTGNILATSSAVGGIIGSIDIDDEKAEFTIDTAVNRGKISSTSSTLGGIFGIIYTNNLTNVYKDLYNYGSLKGVSNIGGMVGQFVGGNTSDHWDTENPRFYASGPRTMTNTFDKCVSTGDITGSGSALGGLFGTTSTIAVAPYATTGGNTYKTVSCPKNGNIYHREIDIKYYDVTSIFNVQNSYFSGNITEAGSSYYTGGLFGYLDTQSVESTFTNKVQVYDENCVRTTQNTNSYKVARLSQTNVKNSYSLGTINSDHAYTGTLFGRLVTLDSVPATNEYKKKVLGEGKSMISSLSNVYSASSLGEKGSAITGYPDNKTCLTVSNVYTWAGGVKNNLVWANETSLNGHTGFNFDESGIPMAGTAKLLDKLNTGATSLSLTSWKGGSYVLPDKKTVTVPVLDLKPQLTAWDPWEGE